MLKFNINNYVEFELTEYGAKVLQHREDTVSMRFLKREKKQYIEGQTMKMPMWEMIGTFGEHTGLGMKTFCKEVTIRLSEEDLT